MADAKQTNVLLFGLGAIGGFYAFILGRDPTVRLTVVARSNFEVVKTGGLKIDSANHGKQDVRIDEVVRRPTDAGITFDFIVCTNKAVNQETIPPLFAEVTNDDTTFVILQNGVGNEEPFRNTFPRCTIVSGLVWVGATQDTPGLIKHISAEDTELGLFRNPNLDENLEKQRLDRFAKILKAGGTNITLEDNMQLKRWEKVIWNAAWNPITTLTQVNSHTWLDSSPEAVPLTRRLWTEMIDVARKSGVPVEYSIMDEFMRRIRALPPIFTSMYVDSTKGRELEVEVILGTPMRRARELGVDVPVLSAIYSMTMAVNERIRQGRNQAS